MERRLLQCSGWVIPVPRFEDRIGTVMIICKCPNGIQISRADQFTRGFKEGFLIVQEFILNGRRPGIAPMNNYYLLI